MVVRRLQAVFAAALAAVVAVALLGLGASSAHAEGEGEQPLLTITKYTTPTHGEGTGTIDDDPGGEESPNKPIEGVEYTVYKVTNIDMNTNAGWQQAAALQTKFESAPRLETVGEGKYEQVAAQTTEADGTTIFTLGDTGVRGLYVVVESSVEGAKVAGKPVKVSPAKPFLVAVPMTDPDYRDGLLWQVNVFPKNAPIYANKRVGDSTAFTVGSTVSFPVNTGIPEGTDLDKYVVIDKFDPAHLQFESVDSVTVGETELAATTDYAVSNTNGLVKVTFTEEGLKKLRANAGKEVETVFQAKVLKVADSNGEITNTAYVVPSTEFSEDPDSPAPAGKRPPIPSNTVTSHYAKIVVNKLGEGGAPLAGAKFKLSVCADDSFDGLDLTVNEGQDDAASVFTSDEKGKVVIDGVRVADYENGKQKENATIQYCLTETEAPAGYELLAEPIKLDVTMGNVTNGVYSVDVQNVKHNAGFHLPKTGSSAAILLGVVGALMLAAGVVVTLRKRQRR